MFLYPRASKAGVLIQTHDSPLVSVADDARGLGRVLSSSLYYSTNVFDLFGAHGELAKKHFLEGVHFVDVCHLADEDIKKYVLFGLTELAFKYKKTKDFERFLETAIPWLHRVELEIGSDYAIIFVQYIVEVFEECPFGKHATRWKF